VTVKDFEPVLPAPQSKKLRSPSQGPCLFKSTIQSIFSGGLDGTQSLRGSPSLRTGGGDAIVVEPLHVGERSWFGGKNRRIIGLATDKIHEKLEV
jgi:hypothetical protein